MMTAANNLSEVLSQMVVSKSVARETLEGGLRLLFVPVTRHEAYGQPWLKVFRVGAEPSLAELCEVERALMKVVGRDYLLQLGPESRNGYIGYELSWKTREKGKPLVDRQP